MERICDHVGIIKDGKMLVEMPIDTLKDTVKLLRITGEDDMPLILDGCRIISSKRVGSEQLVTVELAKAGQIPVLPAGLLIQEVIQLSLEEIFVALLDDSEAAK
jgi:ABC-type multidrug transport system ATPase subunit